MKVQPQLLLLSEEVAPPQLHLVTALLLPHLPPACCLSSGGSLHPSLGFYALDGVSRPVSGLDDSVHHPMVASPV